MVKIEEGSLESEVVPELLLEEYYKVTQLDETDFKENWRKEASVYREILWALIREYSDGQCEMTHSEFIKDKETGEVKTISLCATIFEDSGCDFQGFVDYLKKHINIIPSELRDSLMVYIGYNYGDKGGVKIKGNEIEYIDQKIVDSEAMESDGSIGFGEKPETMHKLQKIYGKVVKEINKSYKN